MGNGLIAFLIAAGASTWLYAKFMRKSGNNTQSSIIAVVIIAAFIFIITLIAANTLLPSGE